MASGQKSDESLGKPSRVSRLLSPAQDSSLRGWPCEVQRSFCCDLTGVTLGVLKAGSIQVWGDLESVSRCRPTS
jgi:hypothetical protein